MRGDRIDGAPRTAVVIGAGIVGLSTAWFLQERGVEVTVVDRDGVAAGASWGNAGWLSPGLSAPLPEPAVLRYGLRSLLDPRAPLYVPAVPDPGLWAFLARFAAHCTWRSWRSAMAAYLPINAQSLEAFDVLVANGVDAPTIDSPIVAAFSTAEQVTTLRRELELMNRAGQQISFCELTGDELRAARPQISEQVAAGLRLDDQRYVDPGQFLDSLARSVLARGGATIRPRFTVSDVQAGPAGITVRPNAGPPVTADAVVLATGARLNELGRTCGLRVPVRAGRGYSFTVPTDEPVPGPIYLPGVRIACTPYRGELRVAGTMEFRGADAPLDPTRIDAIVASARSLLSGVRWDERGDLWVGPRPITPDGLPLIGAAGLPGIYVAGGHGMWGLTLGPITGRLLAEQITTGKQPTELRPFDPLR
jgi:D-amino-acid dehydrogenase